MKTPKQIRRYLRKQPWYEAWLKFTWMQQPLKEFLLFALGYKDTSTIQGFSWQGTVQGGSFWNEVDNKFKTWYYEQE